MTGNPDVTTLQGLAKVLGRYTLRPSVSGPGIVMMCADCLGRPMVRRWPTNGPVSMLDLIGAITEHSVNVHPGTQG